MKSLVGSTDFSRAILGAAGMTLPILLGIRFDLLLYCIPVTTGVLLASPSDTKGSFKLKLQGIVFSTLLSAFVFLIAGYSKVSLWLLLPITGILTFMIAYLSIYGFRASLVSFSGLLALVLGLSNLNENILVWQAAALVGLGGIWYLLLCFLYHLFFPRSAIEESLSHSLKLTAKYMNTRGKLIDPEHNRKAYLHELLQLQTQITESHETLRELLIRGKRNQKSVYTSVRLLVFIQLIEILELAVSNPVDYDNADKLFKQIPDAKDDFQQLLFKMSKHLLSVSKNLSKPHKILPHDEIELLVAEIEFKIRRFESKADSKFDNQLLTLKNYIKYLKQQSEKIMSIKQFLRHTSPQQLKDVRKKDLSSFVSQQDYELRVLTENLSFKSSIFRHSLRIAVVMFVGSLFGLIADPENYYWVLMTIIVIMRPNYGLTKKRSRQRTVGTVLGAGIALLLIVTVQNPVIYGIAASVSLLFAFAFLQRNYSTAAIYITLSIVLSYALLTPDALSIIGFRLVDTGIGVVLAVAGNMLLWPAWEIKSMRNTFSEAISAQKNYLEQIADYYNQRGELSQQYRLSRKQAFLSVSELTSAFHRMTQEPVYKQNHPSEVFELVLLSHSFLVSSASLGTYMVNNPTTPASDGFNSIIALILNNLHAAEIVLKKEGEMPHPPNDPEEVIRNIYGKDLETIFTAPDYLISEHALEEAHLVLAQLKWMLNISSKVLKIINEIKNDFG